MAKTVVFVLAVSLELTQANIFKHVLQVNLGKNVSALQRFWDQNGKQLDTNHFYKNFLRSDGGSIRMDVSDKCATQMDIVLNNSDFFTNMIDAWSKFPYSGLLVASNTDLGSYDQCISLEHEENGERILGKHCTYGWIVPLAAERMYILSYCTADACNAGDVRSMISSFLPESLTYPDELVNDYFCATKETNTTMDASEIAVISFFAVFLLAIVVSTSYDVISRMKKRHSNIVLKAFSVVTNGEKLFKVAGPSGNQEQILAFHGLKAVSMMWILAGHSIGLFTLLPALNGSAVDDFQKTLGAFYLMGAYFAVDTFFYLSGFLIAYQYFKTLATRSVKQQLVSVPSMIIHRYIRITPALLMLFLYGVYLTKFIGTGPMANMVNQNIAATCKENWWSVFLYIQNYYNFDSVCYVHLWYLSTDFQLFLLTPFLLIPVSMFYKHKFTTVLVSLLGLNVFFTVLPLITKLTFQEYDPDFIEYDTQSKLIDYFLGFTMGLYIRCQRHKRYPFNSTDNKILWALTLALMLGTLLVYQEVSLGVDQTYLARSLSYTFTKPVWCIGLSFIVFACANGKGVPYMGGTFYRDLYRLCHLVSIIRISIDDLGKTDLRKAQKTAS